MSAVVQATATVCIGVGDNVVGRISYTRSGARENSSFSYEPAWLRSADRFSVSPDIELIEGHQYHKAATKEDSVFHLGIADTAPDGWGCRVIARDDAKQRKARMEKDAPAPLLSLTPWDYLVGVDDFSRIGALRLRDERGNFLRTIVGGGSRTPPLIELAHLMGACQAVEKGTETEADLRYLRGRGTSLGGQRPKCSVVDVDGQLAIAKFPSIGDTRAVTRGEVLTLNLARLAGIDAAHARIVYAEETPITLIRRFDRTIKGERMPFLSAASFLLAKRDEDRAYTEIADRIISHGARPRQDLEELWRRIVFNLLVTNVDDHLRNHGFLHVAHGQWRLSPAFDVNPFPDNDQELKLWLSEASGPVTSIEEVVRIADYFWLKPDQALKILGEVYTAIQKWRALASMPAVGLTAHELRDFAPAFEHATIGRAAKLLGL